MLDQRRHLKAEALLWSGYAAVAGTVLADSVLVGVGALAATVAVGFVVDRRRDGRR